jgi:uncharacterized protein (TIGR00730 family)
MSYIPPKAYKNSEFLNSPSARHIRILCEYEETRQRFIQEDVHNTLVFFGSARTKSSEDSRKWLERAEATLKADPTSEEAKADEAKARIAVKSAPFYDAARELGRRMTAWSMARAGEKYLICSGGGPGIMEAANRGASEAGGRSIGLGISLPFEQGVNAYCTPELSFEFHYFFTRKYWFLYPCKAVVYFPGGFGTMDELFETTTLVQTGKISKPMPMVLFGTDYWDEVLDMKKMADWGTISPEDPDLLFCTNSVDEAFEYLTTKIIENETAGGA